jgi:ABC-type phosphate/phosphonate transport system ATPase subunit
MRFVILIGASGSGKTTIARTIAQRFASDLEVFDFDRIGMPSAERMHVKHGSAEGCQRAKTIEWMATLGPSANLDADYYSRVRPTFPFSQREPRLPVAVLSAHPVDCDDETRSRRL